MREIYVFDDRDNYTARWLRSLVWAEEELRDLGFSVKFHSGKTLIPRRIYQHMDTFPQWFIPNETYIPVKWDFSDFTEIIESVKEPAIQKHYLDIAIHGQEMFRNFMTTREGRQEFAKHLADMLVP